MLPTNTLQTNLKIRALHVIGGNRKNHGESEVEKKKKARKI